MARPARLLTAHGAVTLPAFLPDATRAGVKGLAAEDLTQAGIELLMVNAFHLAQDPGTNRIAALGGIHRFMGWHSPVASDSGGFQAYSLLAGKGGAIGRGGEAGGAAGRARAGRGALSGISDEGISVRRSGRSRRELLTPEKSIRQQMRLGADILFCLDQCGPAGGPPALQREAVDRTVAWARRCRRAFDRLLETGRTGPAGEEGRSASGEPARPLLFAVVQGGADRALRRECAERLLEIGFDGYGFGGWPVDDAGRLSEMVAYLAELLPREVPLHGLGIGKPETLVSAWRAGYRLFDCVIPTRDGRHGRLFCFREDPRRVSLTGKAFYREIGIGSERYARADGPLEPGCPCPLCAGRPTAYLHHLFASGDPAGPRLATIHNLVFYRRLIDALRERAAEAEG